MKNDGRFKKGQNTGINNFNWAGGIARHSAGYLSEQSIKHPNADCRGYVFQHRLVMESRIGRYLRKDEIVHHINGIKDDNRIENLVICTKSNHLKNHRKLAHYNKDERPENPNIGDIIAVHNYINKPTKTTRFKYSKCIRCGNNFWINIDSKRVGCCSDSCSSKRH